MRLQRVWRDADTAFGGMADDEGRVFFTTLEHNPIPAGRYVVCRVVRPIHGECFEVQRVRDRTGILFHSGAFEKHSRGCILTGFGFGEDAGQPYITNGHAAYDRFMRFLARLDTFDLVVCDPSL